MKPLVLLDPHPRTSAMIFRPADRDRLHALADVVTRDAGPLDDTMVDECLPRTVAILGQTPMPAERLARAPALRAIFNVEGNFVQNVDYDACFRRGIRVASAAPTFARPVAEYALALMLDLLRGVTFAHNAFRLGREAYGWRGNQAAVSLFEADVAIVGLGNVGRMLMSLLAPFRCRIRVYDPWLPDAVIREHGGIAATLAEALSRSRIVVVLAAATHDNAHFIGADELGRMPPGSKLVLLSRADVVDFEALRAATESGRIEAAIDVFPDEPVPPDHPIRRAPGILLSSHRAGGLDSALKLIGEMAVDDLALVLRGLPPVRLQAAQPETVGRQRSRAGLGAAAERDTHDGA